MRMSDPDESQSSKAAPSTCTTPRMRPESMRELALRTNFRKVASFLVPQDTNRLLDLCDPPEEDRKLAIPMCMLARHGLIEAIHFNMSVRKLVPATPKTFEKMCLLAAKGDHSSVIEYFFRHHGYFPHSDLTHVMSMRGATRCVLYVHGILPFCDDRLIVAAARSGDAFHLNHLARATNLQLSARCMVQAVLSGSLPLLRWLYHQNCPNSDRETSRIATECAPPNIIRFLMSRNLKFDGDCITVAMLANRPDVVTLLLEYGVIPSTDAMRTALMKNDMLMFEKFLANGAMPSTELLLECIAGKVVGGRNDMLHRLESLGVCIPPSLLCALDS